MQFPTLLTDKEKDLFAKVLAFEFLPGIRLGDLFDRLSFEVSPEKMSLDEVIDKDVLERRLPFIIQSEKLWGSTYERLSKEFRNRQRDMDPQERIAERRKITEAETQWSLRSNARRQLESVLGKAQGGLVHLERVICGQFLPSPAPTVVLYLGSFNGQERFRHDDSVPVLVHELFHAYNFFTSGGASAVREVQEPMVEVATLAFLSRLEKNDGDFDGFLAGYYSEVREKATQTGRNCCYGFGHFLFDNITGMSGHGEDDWITRYASLSGQLPSSGVLIDRIRGSLYPQYPFDTQEDVLRDFEALLFGGGAKSSPSHRDAVLDCIRTLGMRDFSLSDIYTQEGTLQALFPNNKHLKEKIRQVLQRLIKEGVLSRTSAGQYHVN